MIVKAQGFGGNTTDRGRYDPATDSWRSMAPDPVVPIDRLDLPAVWTGTEMILWGGMSATGSVTNVGSRYNPTSDQWMPTSTGVNVPAARSRHTAVWTGSKMIIWGGDLGNNRGVTFTGGTYDPITDTWEPTPLDNVPNGRLGHTAVWSGTEMIVWGGGDPGNTGGRFDPVSNSWRPTSTGPGVPGLRADHTAVWASGKMIVWGGRFFPGSVLLNTGGIYDPVSDSWTPTAVSSGTPSARISHTTVWTGDEMIVWGGVATGVSALRNGARYRPQTDTWVPVSNGSNMPAPRSNHLAVWSGTEMIIWGGGLDSGGRYDPLLDSWTATSRGAGTPAPRTGATAVWTGSEMIVWGGNTTSQGTSNTGGRYDPIHDIWRATAISPTTPVARFDHTSVWTGSEMIVWGGFGLDSPQLKTGGRYDPSSDTWKSTSVGANVPMERRSHTAVWTGDRMIVWGGTTGFVEYLDSGGRYDPLADSWLPTVRTAETPKGRIWHTAIWTGSEMIVWGGYGNVEGYSHAGSRYDPVADRWLPLPPMIEESVSRILHTAAWTGTEMIVWGGFSDAVPYPYYLDTGERYDPVTGTWTLVSQEGHVPSVRRSHTTVWTGEEMVVWGGSGMYDLALNSGGRYCAPTNRPPQAEAGGDQRLECVNGGASVLLDGSASSDPDSTPGTDDDIVSYVWTEGALTLAEGPQVVVPLVLGAHTVRLTIRDHGGATSSDELIVTVSDQTPPNLHLDLAPQVLWPPNHRMVDVAAAITASDACGSVAIVLESVSSSEPDDSLVAQDGETSADIQGALPGTDDRAFQLRAERDGDGPGRTYTATFLAADPSGNATVATASVVVPHDRSHLDNPISLRVSNTAATTVSWQSVDTAHHFDVLRGSLRSLRTNGNGIDLGVTTCVTARVRGTSSAEQPDTAVPPRGEGYFYLVQYFDGERESSWGEPSADRPRAPGMGSPSCE